MNKTLFDAFETWLQDRISAAFNGLLSRIERLEELNVDDQITGLRMENDKLRRWLAALNVRITELEDRRVENAPDEQLDGFKERVIECFDSEEFRDAVNDQVAEYIDNSDDVCGLDDVRNILRNDVRVSLDVERY